jgi:signal transduction histidine kinase
MTLKFASRAAAKKLGLIVALLLIPALFFGGAYVRQSLAEIAMLEREMQGVKLAALVYPALEKSNRDSTKADLNKIARLEKILDIARDESFAEHLKENDHAHQSALSDTQGSNTKAHDHDGNQIAGYIADISTSSGLILDSDGESYHLANLLLIDIPVVWNSASSFETFFLETTARLSTRAKLAVFIGNLESAFERQKNSIRRAAAVSENKARYSSMFGGIDRLQKYTTELSALVTGPQAVLDQQQIVELTSSIREQAQALVQPAFKAIEAKLEERRRLLNSMLYLILAIGVGAAALTTLLATRMISTTFKKLDAVEEAHRVSETMRQEANRVNDEVADLNRHLAQNFQKLQEAQQELLSKGKMEQLGQLTATVAHEIRNPLGSVRTSAFLIGRKIDAKSAGIETQLERINKGVDRCDNIITQLLDFSRTKQIITQASRLDDWIESILPEESENLPAAVAVECVLGLGDLEVHFDQARMRRALSNLMHNAAEAMVGKGEKSEVRLGQKPSIHIETRQNGESVEIVVKDNGPGMSAEVLEKIREPLFTTKSFGTGLGIPAVEQIVKQHGGLLLAQSEPGQGATFTIRIPLRFQGIEAA